MSRATSTSPSEGEIVESGSEKATTSIDSYRGTSIDPKFRHRSTVSRSPPYSRSPRPYRSRAHSRDRSRSPYRESTASKRPHDNGHYDRSRSDPRRFKVRYEDLKPIPRHSGRPSHREIDRADDRNRRVRYDGDQASEGRSSNKQHYHRTRRSPPYQGLRSKPFEQSNSSDSRNNVILRHERTEQNYTESKDKLSSEQSVSGLGHNPVATVQSKHDAEINGDQTQRSLNGNTVEDANQPAMYVSTSLVLEIY